jgi:hypothetical protein
MNPPVASAVAANIGLESFDVLEDQNSPFPYNPASGGIPPCLW